MHGKPGGLARLMEAIRDVLAERRVRAARRRARRSWQRGDELFEMRQPRRSRYRIRF